MNEWRAVIVCEHAGRCLATYHDVPEDSAHFDLTCLWLALCERAERLRSIASMHVTNDDRGRSVVLSYPPIDRSERARSDDAHARTVAEAIAILTR